jgi:outer membrane protein assembly factor BamB
MAACILKMMISNSRAAVAPYVVVLLFIFAASPVQAQNRLSSQSQARHLGLNRAWFTQVRLNPAQHRVERAMLTGDRLSVLTTAGILQELDAITGKTLWIAPVGNPDHPSLGPAANDQFVALLNGSTLYVLDRNDGRPVIVRPVGGAPGAAPALAKNHVFVPLVTGRIEAYSLGEQKLTPWYYQSFGRALVAPLTTPTSFVWATDSGHLYVGRTEELGLRFRLETNSPIVASPAYQEPYIYAATFSGEVFAMQEANGTRRWKYATGFPITRSPAPVGGKVFVTSEEPALHCIDAKRGTQLWEVPKITQFAALSKDRVYGVDELGGLVALDAKTGALLGRMATDISTHALVNDQTDRVYLVSTDGVVECLHEIGAEETLYHNPPPTGPLQPADAEAAAPAETPSQQPENSAMPSTTDESSPFEVEDANDAEAPADADAGAEDADDNPFNF